MNRISIYEYIAASSPWEAKAIVSKYGYSLQGVEDGDVAALGTCLEQLVAAEGRPAFLDMLALHPDRDAILETFGGPAADCGCKDGPKKDAVDAYLHPQAPADPHATTPILQGNTFLIAAALLLAVAIVARPSHN